MDVVAFMRKWAPPKATALERRKEFTADLFELLHDEDRELIEAFGEILERLGGVGARAYFSESWAKYRAESTAKLREMMERIG